VHGFAKKGKVVHAEKSCTERLSSIILFWLSTKSLDSLSKNSHWTLRERKWEAQTGWCWVQPKQNCRRASPAHLPVIQYSMLPYQTRHGLRTACAGGPLVATRSRSVVTISIRPSPANCPQRLSLLREAQHGPSCFSIIVEPVENLLKQPAAVD
jgi:hypothetical protein